MLFHCSDRNNAPPLENQSGNISFSRPNPVPDLFDYKMLVTTFNLINPTNLTPPELSESLHYGVKIIGIV